MKMRGFGWKKNKNYIVYFLTCMVLVGIMLIFSYSKVIQAKEAERVVKIGIYELPGFCEVQDDGYVGYNMEYLAEVAELTGWKYEYVVVSDYLQLFAGRQKQRRLLNIAQSPSGKAPDFDSGIRWFESNLGSHGGLAKSPPNQSS